MSTNPNVRLHWRSVRSVRDPNWQAARCLYAYLAPEEPEILYIGKADGGSTVRRRWNASDKIGLHDALEQQRGTGEHRVIVGHVESDWRLTRQLLADVETLLIHALEPWGNIAAIRSRIARPGLHVRCLGRAWPHQSRRFLDYGHEIEWQ